MMRLFGVINASPDSLNEDSIATTPAAARARADLMIAEGVWGFDIGGQGSTFAATEVPSDDEWARLDAILPTIAAYGMPFSVDTWRPDTARRSLEAGATWLNAADGLQQDEMMEVAAEFGCPVVLPFLSGPDPLRMALVTSDDPLGVIVEYTESILQRADRFGIRSQVVIDPGTGFAPHHWAWDERFVYQKKVYSQLDRLRVFGLPLYIASAVERDRSARGVARHRHLAAAGVRALPLRGAHPGGRGEGHHRADVGYRSRSSTRLMPPAGKR